MYGVKYNIIILSKTEPDFRRGECFDWKSPMSDGSLYDYDKWRWEDNLLFRRLVYFYSWLMGIVFGNGDFQYILRTYSKLDMISNYWIFKVYNLNTNILILLLYLYKIFEHFAKFVVIYIIYICGTILENWLYFSRNFPAF